MAEISVNMMTHLIAASLLLLLLLKIQIKLKKLKGKRKLLYP
jgi:hypothetical protein